jgi:hypothetical protein
MDLTLQLKRQVDFIERSCEIFDQGHEDEALRIALSIRVLIHDTNQSKSLLTLLGVKNKIKINTTMTINRPENLEDDMEIIYIPLMITQFGRKPPLEKNDIKGTLSVNDWWNETIMIQFNSITRKDIILTAANQDGGAHVDNKPSSKTKELKEGIGILQITEGGITHHVDLIDHHFPLIRQFAFELLESPDFKNLLHE